MFKYAFFQLFFLLLIPIPKHGFLFIFSFVLNNLFKALFLFFWIYSFKTNEFQIRNIFLTPLSFFNVNVNVFCYFARRMIDPNNKESKNLKEDSKGCMYIKDVAEIEVKSTEEALDLMQRAQKRRVVAYTDLNAESSRSHSIFTIRVVQVVQQQQQQQDAGANTPSIKNAVHVSQLSLVDLAGSERTKRTKNTGSRLREAGSINSSLMALRNCMETLRENTNSCARKVSVAHFWWLILESNCFIFRFQMVPYRDSKLTLLFKNYFEGHGRIKMILCINPSAVEFDETIVSWFSLFELTSLYFSNWVYFIFFSQNVLKFSDLIKDVLVPVVSTEIQHHNQHRPSNFEKVTMEALEQANLVLLSNLQKKYAHLFLNFCKTCYIFNKPS